MKLPNIMKGESESESESESVEEVMELNILTDDSLFV